MKRCALKQGHSLDHHWVDRQSKPMLGDCLARHERRLKMPICPHGISMAKLCLACLKRRCGIEGTAD